MLQLSALHWQYRCPQQQQIEREGEFTLNQIRFAIRRVDSEALSLPLGTQQTPAYAWRRFGGAQPIELKNDVVLMGILVAEHATFRFHK